MSLKDCIRASRAAGEITLEEAQALEKRYDQIARQVLSPASAKQQLAAELEAEAFEKKRRALLTETVRQQVDQDLLGHRNRSGQQDPAEALSMMLEHFGQGRMQDVEHKRLAILGGAHAKLDQLLYDMRKGAVSGDLRRRMGGAKAKLENVVREAFGEGTGDARASELAKAWADVSEDLRQRFNAAGGAVGKLEKWGLPQHHDGEALLRAGADKWIEHIYPLLDRDRMQHPLTKTRMTDAELKDSLRHVWETVTSEGWIDREATGASGGKGALFRQHADHRFLIFKDADSWLKYQRDFGEGDPFAAMMGHVSTMARDIAFMEQLGPNPDAMFTYAKQRVMKLASEVRPVERLIGEKEAQIKALASEFAGEPTRTDAIVDRIGNIHRETDALRRKTFRGATKRGKKQIAVLQQELFNLERELSGARDSGTLTLRQAELQAQMQQAFDELNDLDAVPFAGSDPLSHARASIAKAESMWAVMRGSMNAPVNSRWANGMTAARNLISAATLGSAQVAALSDVGFQGIRRAFVGVRAGSLVSDVTKMFGKDSRREAVRAGLILDTATHVMHQQARYVGSINSRSITGYLADRVIHMQGLSAWTQAGKHAFGMAFQAELADRVKLPLDKLPDALRRTLDRHGITAADWDQIRTAQLYEPKPGATFLRPNEIASISRPLSEKYIAMIMRETRYAVPESTVASRTAFVQGTRPGTFIGEVVRNASQFKSFGVAVVMLHGSTIAREIGAGRGAQGALYAGALLLTGGILGSLSLQLKEIVQGRDPLDMTTPEFWGAALLQGGGMGIYGDFLFANVNRFGSSTGATVAGPFWDRFSNVKDLTIGNIAELAQGKETHFGREAVKFLRMNTPGGSLWYVRRAYEAVVLDQLQWMADPEAYTAFRRKKQNRKKTYGNEYWWHPGDVLPRRAPDLGSAFGP
jgi:hypothetical protein